MSPTPFPVMAGQNSLCDLSSQDCSTFKVFGQDFVSSSELGCRVRPVSVEGGEEGEGADSTNWKYLGDSEACEAQYLEETAVQCSVGKSLLDRIKTSLTLEIEITNTGSVWSSGIFLTIYNSSCDLCSDQASPLLPKTCRQREEVCR